MISIYDYISLGAMAIMTFLILVQTRGATLGAGLGAGGEINTVRRGSDKTIFWLTIIFALIFVGSLVAGVLLAK
jgi:preprotein translocase subunit SecG